MRRLVEHTNPEGVATPLLLLADLRGIDPLIELVYVGDQLWWIGRVSPNDVQRDKGLVVLQQLDLAERENPEYARTLSFGRNRMLGQLVLQGFSRILQVRAPGDVSGTVFVEWVDPASNGQVSEYETTIFREIRERYWHFNADGGKAIVEQRMALTDPETLRRFQKEQIDNYLKNEGLSLYRREFRNRVQVGYGGTTGVRGDEIASGLLVGV